MNAKISGFVICAETIVYLLLDTLHDCNFNDTVGAELANCCHSITPWLAKLTLNKSEIILFLLRPFSSGHLPAQS